MKNWALFLLLLLGSAACLLIDVIEVSAASLSSTSTVADFAPANWNYWDRAADLDTIFYGWTATSTVQVCGVQVPVSRETVSTPTDHEIPITVGIVVSTTTTPENTSFITNTSFGSGLLSGDYTIALQPTSTATVIFTITPESETLACQTINAGETLWIKINDLDFPMPDTDAMRYGSHLSYSNIGTRFCSRLNSTGVTTCLADGSGALRILNDADAIAFDLVFSDPVKDYDTSTITPELSGMAKVMSDLAKWLFVPSSDVQGQYTAARTMIETKAPFGWFAAASTTLTGLNDAADVTTSTQFMMTVNPGSGTTTATFFNPAGVESFIPDDTKNTVKGVIAVGMWALFFAGLVGIAVAYAHSTHDS